MERAANVSPLVTARAAGVFYAVCFVSGGLALSARGRLGLAANVVAGVSYLTVTILFYKIFKPAGRGLSLTAALFSLAGLTLGSLGWQPQGVNVSMVAFGVYCLLIGSLIFRSTFLPRALGALMTIAGLGWLTFLSPALIQHVRPYNLAPGLLGEGALTLWLLVIGVNEQRWKEQASTARAVA